MTFKKLPFVPKRYMLCFFLLGGILWAHAQQKTITGTVISATDNLPIPGVNVVEKGTSNGVTTDFDGNYSINISGENAIIVFSYIGFVNQEVSIGSQKKIDITLKENVSELSEIVVVGYGSQKKSDLTGSVASVKEEELTAYPVLTAAQALQGRAAGVSVQSNNGGEPGASIKVRVRGGTSINASSDALVVVDGFVGATMPAPEDIASIEVLKDASATAIYGSRGANGVILITTKKGGSGKTTVEINSSYTSQKVLNRLDLLNASQYAAYRNAISGGGYTQGPADTDWQDEVYRTGMVSNNQVSVAGGTDKSKYYISGTYYDQDGVVLNSAYERFSFLSNIDVNITDKLKAGINVFGRRTSNNGVATQSASGGAGGAGVISAAYRFTPDLGIYDANGDYETNNIGDEIDNAYALAKEKVNETKTDDYRANLFAEYEILKGLSFKTTFGFSTTNRMQGQFTPTTLINGRGVGGEASVQSSKSTNLISENYLTYNKEIGKGNLTLLAGYSYQGNKYENVYAAARGFVTNSVSYSNLGGGSVYLKPDSSFSETEIKSVFGRANFEYDDKYLLTFTARRDGASAFSKNHKYAFFPSGAIGWRMSNESFLKESNTISNWKWRASYGVTGNQSIGAYQTLARFGEIYTVVGDEIVNGVAVTVLANDNLKWESSYQTDLGVDIGLLNNAINFTFDYYNIQTKDLLFARPLPEYIGLANPYQTQNIGELENKGFEITISTHNITNENFTWNTDFNFSKNKNTVKKLPDGEDVFINSAPSHFLQGQTQVLREGEPVGAFYGYIYDGVIQEGMTIPTGFENQPGGELYRDVNGDGLVNSEDKTIIGNPNPDFIASLNNTFTYKGFDLNVFFQSSIGGDILNYTLLELAAGSSNATTEALNAWTTTNTNTNVPIAKTREKRITSRFVYDGSYVRLKNLSLGYSLPNKLVSKWGIDKIRIFVSAQNLLTFTDYPGVDPEVNYRNDNNSRSNTNLGLDYGSYPNVKSFTTGINIKF